VLARFRRANFEGVAPWDRPVATVRTPSTSSSSGSVTVDAAAVRAGHALGAERARGQTSPRSVAVAVHTEAGTRSSRCPRSARLDDDLVALDPVVRRDVLALGDLADVREHVVEAGIAVLQDLGLSPAVDEDGKKRYRRIDLLCGSMSIFISIVLRFSAGPRTTPRTPGRTSSSACPCAPCARAAPPPLVEHPARLVEDEVPRL